MQNQVNPPSQEELDRVTRITAAILPKHLDAEEVAVGVVMRSWQAGYETSSYTFIKQACLHAIRTWRREHNRAVLLAYIAKPDAPHGGNGAVTTELVERGLSVLDRSERTAVLYRFLLELSNNETANRMRTSPSRVSTLISSSIDKMRKELINGEPDA